MQQHFKSSITVRFGFTLLELLIVMGLMIVLVSMLWSLIRVYSNYYVAGTRRIDRSQLVRSLSQLLNDDLGAAIQDPIHPLPPSLAAEDAVRRFGLLGTNETLRVDVIQVNPLALGIEATITRQAAAGPVQNVKMQVPELKTIYYDFLPLNATTPGKQSGLVRRELSFEDPAPTGYSSQVAAFGGDAFGSDAITDREVNPLMPDPGNPNLSFQPPTIAEQLMRENDPNAMWAPEIVGIRFRYSDGGNWLDSWDSIDKNGLPVAVEVLMKLMAVEDVEKLRKKSALLPPPVPKSDQGGSLTSNDAIRQVGTPVSSGEFQVIPVSGSARPTSSDSPPRTLESLVNELGLAPPVEQRLVVYLATSPLLKSDLIRRPAAPQIPAPSPPPLTTPTPVSPPPAPPKPQPTVPSQQWLRK